MISESVEHLLFIGFPTFGQFSVHAGCVYLPCYWGAFNNYVDRFLPFFTLPCVDSFYTLSVDKQTYFDPLPPHLVNVVIEWPLASYISYTNYTKRVHHRTPHITVVGAGIQYFSEFHKSNLLHIGRARRPESSNLNGSSRKVLCAFRGGGTVYKW